MRAYRYTMAMTAVALAIGLNLALQPMFAGRFPFINYIGAIVLSSWYGGVGPALLAVALCAAAAVRWDLDLYTSWAQGADLVALSLFLALGLAISVFGHLFPSKRKVLDRNRQLEAQFLAGMKIEQATREDKERLAGFLDSSTVVAWMKNAEGQYVYINEPFARQFCPHGESWRGRTDFELWPDIATSLVTNDEKVLQSGRPLEIIEDVPTPDGTPHRWRVYKFPFTGQAGQRYVGGIAFDVTEHVRAEEALRESESRLRRIVDSNMIGICFWTNEGPVFDVNDAFLSIIGYSRDDLHAGMLNWKALTPPEHLHLDIAALEQIRQSGTCLPFEKEYIRMDGTRVPVLTGGARLDDTGERGVAFALDLTERKRAEAALQESEKRFSLFMKHLPGFAHMKNEKQQITYLNEAYEAYLGIQRDDWLGKTADEIFPSETASMVRRNDEWVLANRTTQKTFEDFMQADGMHRYLSYKFPIPGGQGAPILGGIAIDMTDLFRAEEERRNLEAQIQHTQKLESLGVLAGGIAHDFNNLLMGILGHASLALEELKPNTLGRDNVQQIEIAALRAAELTKQMLAYSGKGRFVIERVDLSSLVEEMVQLLRISISKSATLECNFGKGLPPIEADSGQLRQIAMNLIINASDALGSQQGLIRITTGTMDVDRAFLDTCYPTDRPAEGVFAYLEVSDTGCGMDAETQKRIFEPFYTTKMTGRGLGLAAVLGIVRGHKGAIQFTSGPSQGTTFKVLFPVVESPPEESCGNGASRVHVAANGTVLVVDDDEMVRTVTRRIIEKFGFTVLLAVDGRDGVDVYREHQHEVSVVLLDMTMPRLNGEDAFREMRQINPDVRVILTSGYNETEVTDKFEGTELAGFIQKPYRAKELLQKLQAEIRGRGAIVTPSSNAVAQPHGSTP